MSHEYYFWIKFTGEKEPQRWVVTSYQQLFHDVLEYIWRNNLRLEWIISD